MFFVHKGHQLYTYTPSYPQLYTVYKTSILKFTSIRHYKYRITQYIKFVFYEISDRIVFKRS